MLELDSCSKKTGTIFVEKKAGLKQNHTHFKRNYDQEKLTKFIATFFLRRGFSECNAIEIDIFLLLSEKEFRPVTLVLKIIDPFKNGVPLNCVQSPDCKLLRTPIDRFSIEQTMSITN